MPFQGSSSTVIHNFSHVFITRTTFAGEDVPVSAAETMAGDPQVGVSLYLTGTLQFPIVFSLKPRAFHFPMFSPKMRTFHFPIFSP